MSTKPSQAKMVVTSSNDSGDDDLGALIYRESQLRKAEAAALSKENSEGTTNALKQTDVSKPTSANRRKQTDFSSMISRKRAGGRKRDDDEEDAEEEGNEDEMEEEEEDDCITDDHRKMTSKKEAAARSWANGRKKDDTEDEDEEEKNSLIARKVKQGGRKKVIPKGTMMDPSRGAGKSPPEAAMKNQGETLETGKEDGGESDDNDENAKKNDKKRKWRASSKILQQLSKELVYSYKQINQLTNLEAQCKDTLTKLEQLDKRLNKLKRGFPKEEGRTKRPRKRPRKRPKQNVIELKCPCHGDILQVKSWRNKSWTATRIQKGCSELREHNPQLYHGIHLETFSPIARLIEQRGPEEALTRTFCTKLLLGIGPKVFTNIYMGLNEEDAAMKVLRSKQTRGGENYSNGVHNWLTIFTVNQYSRRRSGREQQVAAFGVVNINHVLRQTRNSVGKAVDRRRDRDASSDLVDLVFRDSTNLGPYWHQKVAEGLHGIYNELFEIMKTMDSVQEEFLQEQLKDAFIEVFTMEKFYNVLKMAVREDLRENAFRSPAWERALRDQDLARYQESFCEEIAATITFHVKTLNMIKAKNMIKDNDS